MENIYASLTVIYNNFCGASARDLATLVSLGLVVGSLLSTVGSRATILLSPGSKGSNQPDHKYLSPLGKCESCGNTLALWQQIPIFSFAVLRGRCAYCAAKIPWRHLLLEGATAVALVLCMLKWSELKVGVGYFVFVCGIMLTSSFALRRIDLPAQIPLIQGLLGLMASALGFGNLESKQAILGAAIGYIIPAIYSEVNVRINPHHEKAGQAYLLCFASFGAWLGPWIVFETLCLALFLMAISQIVQKTKVPIRNYQIVLISIFSFLRILFD